MLGLTLTDEQQHFRDAIRDFCARECGTREQRDALTDHGESIHSQPLYDKIAELGWIGVSLPEEYGGAGAGLVDQCLLLEEMHLGQAPIGAIRTSLIVAGNYERGASHEQKTRMLGAICNGRPQAIAMSEPEAGSDVANISCRAQPGDGGWIVNGQKTWCSQAHNADSILLICRTSKSDRRHHGLTMLEVPADVEGLEMRGIPTMGGKETNDLFFTDCFIPEANVIGEVDEAWAQLMGGLNLERLILAAAMLGIGQRAFDDTLAYVKQRKQFGRAIGSFQTMKHKIADMATDLQMCRLLVYAVAQQVDDDPTVMLKREASMAKLRLTETARQVALDCQQMMGGYGYATEYDMERHVRTTIISTVYGGTSAIQRDIIASTYGL